MSQSLVIVVHPVGELSELSVLLAEAPDLVHHSVHGLLFGWSNASYHQSLKSFILFIWVGPSCTEFVYFGCWHFDNVAPSQIGEVRDVKQVVFCSFPSPLTGSTPIYIWGSAWFNSPSWYMAERCLSWQRHSGWSSGARGMWHVGEHDLDLPLWGDRQPRHTQRGPAAQWGHSCGHERNPQTDQLLDLSWLNSRWWLSWKVFSPSGLKSHPFNFKLCQ